MRSKNKRILVLLTSLCFATTINAQKGKFITIGVEPVLSGDLPEDKKIDRVNCDTIAIFPKAKIIKECFLQLYSLPLDVNRLKITSKFGWRKDPFAWNSKYHGGIDFKAKQNLCLSVINGIITRIGYDQFGYGHFIEIKNQSFTFVYGHMSLLLVKRGDIVRAGQIIGITGSTGRSTGEHLHFTMKINGVLCDPTPFLSAVVESLKNNVFIKITEELEE